MSGGRSAGGVQGGTSGGVMSGGHATAGVTSGGTVAAGRSSSGGTLLASGGDGAGGSAAGGHGGQGGSAACEGQYLACGCGCCGSGVDSPVRCYYPDLGETLATVRAADEAARASTNCALVGCSLGVLYTCCAGQAAEPGGSATYSAETYIGGYNRIWVTQSRSDGQCITLGLVQPGDSGPEGYRIELPDAWGVLGLTVSTCEVRPETESGIGGYGKVEFVSSQGRCLLRIHATLFYAAADGTLAVRFDSDDIQLRDGSCPAN